MYRIIFLLCLISIVELKIPLKSPHRFSQWSSSLYSYKTEWTDDDLGLRVSHFSYTNKDKFNIRYLYNNTYYQPGGAIFFYAGNEGGIESFADNTGIIWDLAKEFNASVVFAEHRYYGKSMPYKNESYSDVTKLGYLTSEQALADYAMFLPWYRNKYSISNDSKVIVFGGSYGGMLAIWFRLKYPTLTAGAWGSSAPVLYFQGGNVSVGGFDNVVKSTYLSSGCDFDVLLAAFDAVTNIGNTDDGKKTLNKIFNINPKDPIATDDDVTKLKYYIQVGMEYMAMTDYPYPTSFLQPMPGWPVTVACSKFKNVNKTSKPEDLATALRDAANVYYDYNKTNKTVCLDTSKCTDDSMGALSDGPDGWDFQECTEIIIEMCSLGKPNDFFDMDCNSTTFMDFQYDLCNNIYGNIGWTPDFMNVNGVKNLYGWDFSKATNIIFTNGVFDPWSIGGVKDTTKGIANGVSRGIYSFLIEGSAHHLDLRQPNTCDPQTIVNVRYQIVQIMKCWLNPDNPNCPFTPTTLPQFNFTNNTNCTDIINGYPWGQTTAPVSTTTIATTTTSTSTQITVFIPLIITFILSFLIV